MSPETTMASPYADAKSQSISQPEDEGFYGALWVQRGRHILEVQLYSTFEEHLYPGMAQKLARACCQTCTVYRTVLKSRQVTQSWIDVGLVSQLISMPGSTFVFLEWLALC